MATQNLTQPFEVGTQVAIRNSGYGPGIIVEFRGPLGPNGARVYRVRVREAPGATYIEVLEDQLTLVAQTGDVCPESGVWKVTDIGATTAQIAKGTRMPPYQGQPVTWELIQ
jgi:hypothetical protein